MNQEKVFLIDKREKEVIRFLQGDLPLFSHPYQTLALRLGCEEQEIVDLIRHMQKQGKIRRLGGILYHRQIGYRTNAMVAWKVERIPNQKEQAWEEDIDRAGEAMARHAAVSHCYWREIKPDWGYPLFTMVHAHSEQELAEILQELATESGVHTYKVIRSVQEFKKTSMVYFEEDKAREVE